jgi:hypothetical protein
MDAPLGEAQELYRVTLDGTGGSIQVETGASALVIDAAEVAAAGSGNAVLSVQQLGDLAASRPAQISITLV